MKIRKKTLKKIGLMMVLIAAILAAYQGDAIKRLWHPDFGYSCKGCNIIFIVIDTLRADHTGAYGYFRDTTPNIDKFAAENILFQNAVAASSWTRTSVASIFTGLYPKNHGAINKTTPLRKRYVTLPEALKEEGYNTYAFMANPSITAMEGFDQGFDYFKVFNESDGFRVYATADKVNELALPLIKKIGGKKNFIYIQYMDPHSAYYPEEKHFSASNTIEYDQEFYENYTLFNGVNVVQRSDREKVFFELINLYDDEILFTDKKVGEIIEALKGQGLYDDSIIIVLSDHGEEFFDHGGVLHSKSLFDEVVLVPFIMHLPGAGSRKIVEQVSHVDILPTLLSLLDIKVGADPDGIDIFSQKHDEYSKYAYSEVHIYSDIFSLRSIEEKLVIGTAKIKAWPVRWFEKEAKIGNIDALGGTLNIIRFFEPLKISVAVQGDGINKKAQYSSQPGKKDIMLTFDGEIGKKWNNITITSLSPCTNVSDLGRTDDRRCISFGIGMTPENKDNRELLSAYGYYSLKEDAGEKKNLYYDEIAQEAITPLRKKLLEYIKDKRDYILGEEEKQVEYEEEQLELLKALGYI